MNVSFIENSQPKKEMAYMEKNFKRFVDSFYFQF